jgi:hypothetical protein
MRPFDGGWPLRDSNDDLAFGDIANPSGIASRISRRAFVGTSLAAGAALALPQRAWAAAATVPAANFFNSIGVVAHSWYANTAWQQRLLDLQILNIRGRIGQSTDAVTRLQTFFSRGGKINTGIVESSKGTLDKTGAQKSLNFLKSNVGLQNISGIEGPNEFNNGAPTNWASILRDFTQWLHGTVRSDASFNAIPLLGPSIWKRLLTDYKALGDISAWVDKGCIHYYSGGQWPTRSGTDSMQVALQNVGIIARGKPIWMTETGWQAPSGNWPVSLRAQAKYVLRDYFDAFGFGVEKIYMYQLIDDQSSLFGLCDAAANPKPAYNGLKNLVGLVKDTAASRGSLGYSIANAPSTLKSFSFSKSDGSFLLVLYLDVSSWNVRYAKDVESFVGVTVNLASPARSVEIYQPTFNSAVVSSASGQSIPVYATDQVTVLKIRF